MFRKVLLVTVAVAAFAAPALAETTFNWTGFHVGINNGIGDSQYHYVLDGNLSTVPSNNAVTGKANKDGFGSFGGGQIGYDYLFANAWLVGFETDADATSTVAKQRGSGPFDTTGSYRFHGRSNIAFLGTARARVGYVLPKNVLVYGTAGLAYGGVQSKYDLHIVNAGNTLNLKIDRFAVDAGWTVGAGVEHPITKRLSLRGEYLYADLGSHTVVEGAFLGPMASGSGSLKAETAAHIARVALNYSLN